MSEADRPNAETSDRTFTDEQKPLFESDDAPEKTRQRTPGAQSPPPPGPDAEAGEDSHEVADAV
jgi:hypothetical protein